MDSGYFPDLQEVQFSILSKYFYRKVLPDILIAFMKGL